MQMQFLQPIKKPQRRCSVWCAANQMQWVARRNVYGKLDVTLLCQPYVLYMHPMHLYATRAVLSEKNITNIDKSFK